MCRTILVSSFLGISGFRSSAFYSLLAVGHCTRPGSALLNVGPSPPGNRRSRLGDRLAAGDGEHLCGDVAGLLGGEEDIRWRDLRRLPSASQRCAPAMPL